MAHISNDKKLSLGVGITTLKLTNTNGFKNKIKSLLKVMTASDTREKC